MLAGDHMVQGDNYLYHGIVMQEEESRRRPTPSSIPRRSSGFAGVAVINRNTPHPYAAALWTDWTLTEESQKYVAGVLRGPIALKHPYLPDDVKIVTYTDAPADVDEAAAGRLEQVRRQAALNA